MADQDELTPVEPEEFAEAPIAEDEVISAARSCSAIIVIVAIVGAIACIMLGIALVF